MNIRGKIIDFSTPRVMGILNITPDSFFDGGIYSDKSEWIRQVAKMIEEGAAIIDIGAVSTRPGAKEISEEEEILRVLPALTTIRTAFPEIIISIDTWRSVAARKALENGADIINDVTGGTFDEKIFKTVAEFNATMILMHMQGNPQNMQRNPVYENVVVEVMEILKTQAGKAIDAGIPNVIIDPGFGFGKTLEHNYILLNHLREFKSLSYLVMAGVSRKSMINKVLGTKPEEALNGTTVANTIALLNGADILRVHDVKEAVETIKIVIKLLSD